MLIILPYFNQSQVSFGVTADEKLDDSQQGTQEVT